MRRRELPESRPGRKERGAARDPRDARMLRTAGKMMALASASASVPVPPARHGHCLGSSAVRDVMKLPSQPSALPAGRAHAQRILSEWGLGPQLSEDAALCLSEPVTGAIRASAVLRPVVAPVHVGLPMSPAGRSAGPDWSKSSGLNGRHLFESRAAGRVFEAGPLIHQGSNR